MEDERLTRLLQELPRERARAGFTAGVLRRLAAGEPGRARPAGRAAASPRFAAAAVTLACLLILLALPRREEPGTAAAPGRALAPSTAPHPTPRAAGPWTAEGARVEPTARLASALTAGRGTVPAASVDRMQARRLLSELQGEEARLERELRRLHRGVRPKVIYLGGDENVDMVIDLNRVSEVRHAAGPPNLM
jgi:hypothetical protein